MKTCFPRSTTPQVACKTRAGKKRSRGRSRGYVTLPPGNAKKRKRKMFFFFTGVDVMSQSGEEHKGQESR